jgi:hypothetical protein
VCSSKNVCGVLVWLNNAVEQVLHFDVGDAASLSGRLLLNSGYEINTNRNGNITFMALQHDSWRTFGVRGSVDSAKR